MAVYTYKEELLKALAKNDALRLFNILDGLRGPYAAAFMLNALAEDEITENGAAVLALLKKQIDPRGDKFEW